jgi:hypothetical protein
MNERIKQLAIQAGFFYEDYKDIWYLEYHNQSCEEEMKKFAELIVRECIAHGKLTQSQTVVNGSEEYNAGREMGIEVFMNQIKKHFGVEE